MSDAALEAHSDPRGDAPHGQQSLLRDRLLLSEVIQLIIQNRCTMAEALAVSELSKETAPGFRVLLAKELGKLDMHNCARYRLTLRATEVWVQAGRPT